MSVSGSKRSFKSVGDFVIASMSSNITPSPIVSIWKPKGDSLEMISFLGNNFGGKYSGSKFDTLVSVGHNYNIFIGSTDGGDGGDMWGNFWIAQWTKPGKFDFLFSKEFGGDDTKRTAVNYNFLNDTTIQVLEWDISARNNYTDSLISEEKLSLLGLIKKNLKSTVLKELTPIIRIPGN